MYTKIYRINIRSVNSLLIAILLIYNYVAALLGFSGSAIFIFSCLLILIICFSDRRINKRSIFVIFSICLLLLLSYFKIRDSYYLDDYLKYFIAIGIVSLYLSSRPFEAEKVISYIIGIGFITLPLFLRIDYWNMLPEYQMGLCYSILPIFLCAILGLSLKSILLKVFSIILILKYGFIFAMIAPRGVILNIVVFIVGLVWVWKKRKWIYNLIAVGGALTLLVVSITNIEKLANSIQNVLDSYNISIYAIYKTVFYLKKGNILNGREKIWGKAIEGIKDKWILGNGIGSYEISYGIYTHNIFLQSWWENGIFYLLFILIAMFFMIYMILQIQECIKRYFVLFLFVMSFGMLLFSSTYWMNSALWFSLGLSVVKCGKKAEKIEFAKGH